MSAIEQDAQGLLIFPHLCVQNANAISSPLTHGFPSITAFLGLMWALERKMAQEGIPLALEKVGVICHEYQELVSDGYVKTFRLTRNPVTRDGRTAPIIEEGRIHLDLTLVFQVSGGDDNDAKNNMLYQDDTGQYQDIAWRVHDLLSTMRVAGGSVLPGRSAPGKRITPYLIPWSAQPADQREQFMKLRRRWLPGFALVGRDDLLHQRLATLRKHDDDATLLDAWLDLSRLNSYSTTDENGKVNWQYERKSGSGWLVPMPVGYGALSCVHDAASVANARDASTPFRFVESLYSLGQWLSPHNLQRVTDLFWWADSQPEQGLYRCRNDYVAPAMDQNELPSSVRSSSVVIE